MKTQEAETQTSTNNNDRTPSRPAAAPVYYGRVAEDSPDNDNEAEDRSKNRIFSSPGRAGQRRAERPQTDSTTANTERNYPADFSASYACKLLEHEDLGPATGKSLFSFDPYDAEAADSRKSYFQKSFPVSKEQYDYFHAICHGMNKADRKLFCQVFISTILKHQEPPEKRYSPIGYQAIDKYAGKDASLLRLAAADKIDLIRYSYQFHKPNRAKIKDWMFDGWFKITSRTPDPKAQRINLITGKPMKAYAKSKLYDHNNNMLPERFRRSVKIYDKNQGRFLFERCLKILDYEEAEIAYWKAEAERRPAGSPEQETAIAELSRAERRHRNDHFYFNAARQQISYYDEDTGVAYYTQVYDKARTGRMTALIGLQSVSRDMKDAAYSGMLNCLNYDLKASQPMALRVWFRKAGIDTSWLDAYLGDPEAKHKYAAAAGLSVDRWKTVLMAIVFGCRWPSHLKELKGKKDADAKPRRRRKAEFRAWPGQAQRRRKKYDGNTINRVIMEEAGNDLKRAEEIYASTFAVIGPLVEQIQRWHGWLMNTWISENSRADRRGRRYIQNDVGFNLYLADLDPGDHMEWQRRAAVAAFLLQGMEANFIYTITIISEDYDYLPVANEHDGLVVIGDIPEEAIQRTRELTGFYEAQLERKSFL